MNTCSIFNRFGRPGNIRIYLLMLLWGVGLFTGVLLALSSADACAVMLKSALLNQPSLLCLVPTVAFPVAIVVLSVYSGRFFLCYPLILLEAFCRGFCGMLVYCVFGSGAWLLRFLFLFSAGCGSVLMWWLLFRHCIYKWLDLAKDVRLAVVLALVFILVDILVISPFLIGLSMYF